jgi:hypothetical protein
VTGFQAVSQVKEWKIQQIVFVVGTCGSIISLSHVESFNRRERVCCFLVLDSVTSTQQWVRKLKQGDVRNMEGGGNTRHPSRVLGVVAG